MRSTTELADEFWNQLKHDEPYFAVVAGDRPASIPPVTERVLGDRASRAQRLLDELRQTGTAREDADLAAVLEAQLVQQVAEARDLWHLHLTAPYQSGILTLYAHQVIAPQPETLRRRLTAEFGERLRSIAALVREQRSRGITLPAPAVPAGRATWQSMRDGLPAVLGSEALTAAFDEVLTEIDESARVAGEAIGLAHRPGGEEVYRSLVHRQTTVRVDPEELHRLGLEQCAELTERMREIRSRLGGPPGEAEARDWVRGQAHLYVSTPDEVAALYRRHIARVEPEIGSLFKTLPGAPHDVRRADPAVEPGMTFGYYQPPTPDDPVGLYRFNGSALAERSQLTAAALILHELLPGHHFHIARQNENTSLHPLQRFSFDLTAFNEGWAEYASGLGWETGAYADDWDAYGRLSHERMTAQRLVVDTALNLGLWDAGRARAFMRANTLEGEEQITSEMLRYATDMPAQALAYRSGFLAFTEARANSAGADPREVHEAMIGGGAVPMPRMLQRVADATT
ncbi:DUF885 domain-containing protein [Lentzea sp. NPDC058436]|uniref:DUF885 domain-containing protein n=1 Tax=Lentzea sp. NPDC058436 TaxID=3346499 RepID=UPI003664C4EE